MIEVLGFGALVLLFVSACPIWVALSTAAIILLVFGLGISGSIVPMQIFSQVDVFTMMACPLFLFAGNVMAYGGSSPYIFKVMNSFVGRMRGGMPLATILCSMIYAAITGSSTATLSGVAAICLPAMRKAGYSDRFTAGLMACCCTLGQLIPPSILMIVYGTITQQNAGTLFISGIVPGIICAGAMMAVAWFKSPKVDRASFDPADFTWKARGTAIVQGAPAIFMPLIVLGSIYGGLMTPTEAGAMSCIYGLFISFFVYHGMKAKELKQSLVEASYSNSLVFTLCAGSLLFSIPLTYMQIPQAVASFVVDMGLGKLELTIAVTIVYLILGCFLDPLPIVYLVLPIVLPSLQAVGINLIHFNIITIISMQIAQVTPPFGIALYMSAKVIDVPVGQVIKECIPYLLSMVVVLLVIIFVPWFSLMFV